MIRLEENFNSIVDHKRFEYEKHIELLIFQIIFFSFFPNSKLIVILYTKNK